MTDRTIRLAKTTRPFEYQSPFSAKEHTLLICVLDEAITAEEQKELAAQIVTSNCRNAVCWGSGCASFEEAIDCPCIETDANFNPSDETFIMTTSHADDSIEDTIEFWWMNTCFNDYDSTRFYVLFVGDNYELITYVQSLVTDLASHWKIERYTLQDGILPVTNLQS